MAIRFIPPEQRRKQQEQRPAMKVKPRVHQQELSGRGRNAGAEKSSGLSVLNFSEDAIEIPRNRIPDAEEWMKENNLPVPKWLSGADLRGTFRRAAERGFGNARFVFSKSRKYGTMYLDPETEEYTVIFNLGGAFDVDTTADHEVIHLWLKAFKEKQRANFVRAAAQIVFGSDLERIEHIIQSSQTYRGLSAELVYEETLAFAYAGMDFASIKFSEYQDAARGFVKNFDLEAIAKGDVTNATVQNLIADNGYNERFVRIQCLDLSVRPGETLFADNLNEDLSDIGLIFPDGETASFTDNEAEMHKDLLARAKGYDYADIDAIIADGGVRVKPGEGIEIDANKSPIWDVLEKLGKWVDDFRGQSLYIDFNLDGASMGIIEFIGEDIRSDKIISYLQNYYNRRKAEISGDSFTQLVRRATGLPAKNRDDAIKLLRFYLTNPRLTEVDRANIELLLNGVETRNSSDLDEWLKD